MTVTPLEWKWRRWRLREGEFAPPWDGPRPTDFPTRIPAAWWLRLAAFLARRKKTTGYTGIYSQPGALARHPRGGVEDIARFHWAGGRWLLWNAEYNVFEWATVAGRCDLHGVKHGPWFHCLDEQDVRITLADARIGGHDLCGINVEQELVTTLPPATLARLIRESGYTGQVVLILLGWQGYVDPDGTHRGPDYSAFEHPALLEVFPQPGGSDDTLSDTYFPPDVKWQHCRAHAKALGLRYPLQLAQTYGDAKPGWYVWHNRAIFTLDDCSPEIEAWL